ncbi:hypothetical protein CXK93_17070 [Stutzerimonas decontaminans]|uniref:Uncharacterized protein n=2 Tax=Stutzerimonas TaxID=2901164 RepID=A0ABX4VUT9_9GAMM|nr:hypothetical protein CXK93_17070 [Stutzerimonas decontaminans]RRV07781.1 hypothetical protein EGJ28_17530 [Stutzerimonas xanthomarina]
MNGIPTGSQKVNMAMDQKLAGQTVNATSMVKYDYKRDRHLLTVRPNRSVGWSTIMMSFQIGSDQQKARVNYAFVMQRSSSGKGQTYNINYQLTKRCNNEPPC